MAKGDLVLLDDLKAWVYKTPVGAGAGLNEQLLKNLITRASQMVVTYTNRVPFQKRTVVELRDGFDSRQMLLREWPVLSVSSVYIDNQIVAQGASVPGSGSFSDGWYLDPWDETVPGNPQSISLYGRCFPRGSIRTQVTYVAGYTVLDEAYTIPSGGGEYSVVTQPTWIQDEGVTFNGTAMTLVAGTTPAAGQYALGSASGQYIFSAADAGNEVKLNYDFVPIDLQQALIEWIAERYAYMSRIGIMSQSVGGQTTVSYSIKAIPEFVKNILDQYKRVAPV